jgi:hypothetical protein
MSIKQICAEDRLHAFMRATGGYERAAKRWTERARTGLTDEQLAQALAYEIGIFGGSCGPGELAITYQSAGLKIWASWEIINHVTEPPVFEGRSTIAMALEVYGIRDSSDTQLSFF